MQQPDLNDRQAVRAFPVSIAYATLASVFFTINLLVVWGGYWLMSAQWPSSLKLWLCSALSTAGIAFIIVALRARRGNANSRHDPQEAGVIGLSHTLGILALLFTESIFVTWVIWGPG